MRRRGVVLLAAGGLAAGVVLLGTLLRPPAPPTTEPSLLVITLDTVRADHLSAYGYARRTTPRLEAFAREATRYTRAWATSPWTLPSHASLFTGKHAFEHGAHTVHVDRPSNNVARLRGRHLTLAEALKQRGYATGATVANVAYLSADWNLDQGFDTYDESRTRAHDKNAEVRAWLDVHGRGPFFFFVNYMDAHRPYDTTPRPGLLDHEVSQDAQLMNQLYVAVLPGDRDPPKRLVDKVVDQYDTAIANLDEEVGRLFDDLKARGLYDDMLIVVASDHGEYFGEHRLVEHSKEVYEEVLRIPLLVKAPRQRSGRLVHTPVSLVDVPRLIAAQMPGPERDALRAAFPYEPGNHPVLAEVYYTRTKDLFDPRWGHRFNRVRTALVEWPYKFIRSSDGQHELYEVAQDEDEAVDLVSARRAVAERMRARIEAFMQRPGAAPAEPAEVPTLSPEQQERLRSLGYVGEP